MASAKKGIGQLFDQTLRIVRQNLPFATKPASMMVITDVGRDPGTWKARNMNDPNDNGFNYRFIESYSPQTAPQIGDQVMVLNDPQGPYILGILSPNTAQTFPVPNPPSSGGTTGTTTTTGGTTGGDGTTTSGGGTVTQPIPNGNTCIPQPTITHPSAGTVPPVGGPNPGAGNAGVQGYDCSGGSTLETMISTWKRTYGKDPATQVAASAPSYTLTADSTNDHTPSGTAAYLSAAMTGPEKFAVTTVDVSAWPAIANGDIFQVTIGFGDRLDQPSSFHGFGWDGSQWSLTGVGVSPIQPGAVCALAIWTDCTGHCHYYLGTTTGSLQYAGSTTSSSLGSVGYWIWGWNLTNQPNPVSSSSAVKIFTGHFYTGVPGSLSLTGDSGILGGPIPPSCPSYVPSAYCPAWTAGWNAYTAGILEGANPYPGSDPARPYWDAGWIDAQAFVTTGSPASGAPVYTPPSTPPASVPSINIPNYDAGYDAYLNGQGITCPTGLTSTQCLYFQEGWVDAYNAFNAAATGSTGALPGGSTTSSTCLGLPSGSSLGCEQYPISYAIVSTCGATFNGDVTVKGTVAGTTVTSGGLPVLTSVPDATTTTVGVVEVDHAPSGAHPIALTTDSTVMPSTLLGTTSTKAAAGNDSRLSDARTPTAHHATHEPGGSDALDLTKMDPSGSALPSLPNSLYPANILFVRTSDETLWQNQSGTWTQIVGSGGGGGGGTTSGVSINEVQLTYAITTDVTTALSAATWANFGTSQPFTIDDGQSEVEMFCEGAVQFGQGSDSNANVAVGVSIDGGTQIIVAAGICPSGGYVDVVIPPVRLAGLSAGSHTLQFRAWSHGANNIFVSAGAQSSTYGKFQASIIERKVVPTGASGTLDQVRYHRSATSQNFTNNTTNIVNFDVQDYDLNGLVATGAAWKFTAQRPGTYRITSAVLVTTTGSYAAGDRIIISLFKNGSSYCELDESTIGSSAQGHPKPNGSDTIFLGVGDYIDVRIFPVTSAPNGTAAFDYTSHIDIERIDGYAINPMTAQNDVIVGGPSGVPTRLAAPSSSGIYGLQSVNGILGWSERPETYDANTGGAAIDMSGAAVGTSVTASRIGGLWTLNWSAASWQYWDVASSIGTGNFDIRLRLTSIWGSPRDNTANNAPILALSAHDSSRTQATALWLEILRPFEGLQQSPLLQAVLNGVTQGKVSYDPSMPLILRITRVGTTVTFWYSPNEGRAWLPLADLTSSLSVGKIGAFVHPNGQGNCGATVHWLRSF